MECLWPIRSHTIYLWKELSVQCQCWVVNYGNVTFILTRSFVRRAPRLRGSRVLREPGLLLQPAVLHRAQAHQHPAPAAAASAHRQLLREDEVHHRGGFAAEIFKEQCLQWKVSVAECSVRLDNLLNSDSGLLTWLTLESFWKIIVRHWRH